MTLPFQEHIDAGVEILKESFAAYFANLWKIAALCSLLMGPPLAADALASTLAKGTDSIAPGILVGVWTLLAFTLLLASLLRLFDLSSKGESPSLLKCLSAGWRPYFKLLALCAIAAAISLAIAAGGIIALLALMAGTRSFLLAFASLLGPALLATCLLVRISLAFPVCLFEGWDFGRLLARSFVQMSGNYLLMLAVYFAGALMAILATIAIAIVAMLALMPATSQAWRLMDDPAFSAAVKLANDIFLCFLAAILHRSYKRLCEG